MTDSVNSWSVPIYLAVLVAVTLFLTKHDQVKDFQKYTYSEIYLKRSTKTDEITNLSSNITNSNVSGTTIHKSDTHLRITDAKYIPFYIYDGPEFNFYNQCIEYYGPTAKRGGPFNITDRDYKHASAFKFIEGIQNHKWRVTDPSLAKIFVVPALLGEVARKNKCNGSSAKYMVERLAKGLSESVHWKKNYGLDHVLVDTDFRMEQAPISIQKYLRNMTVGHHVLAPFLNLNLGLKVNYQYTLPWACTVMVPMNEREIDPNTKLNFEDFKKRPVDLFFMGQWDSRKGYNIRRRVASIIEPKFKDYTYIYTNSQEKSKLPVCNFEKCLETHQCICRNPPGLWNTYSNLIGQSKFAFAMSGDNAGSTRYFDAPNSGSIPIFIANQAFTDALPFVWKVPWRDFSFFLPESNTADLEHEIKQIVGAKEKVLHRKFEMMMRYRDEISWTRNASQVGQNFLEEAWDRCISPFIKEPAVFGK